MLALGSTPLIPLHAYFHALFAHGLQGNKTQRALVDVKQEDAASYVLQTWVLLREWSCRKLFLLACLVCI